MGLRLHIPLPGPFSYSTSLTPRRRRRPSRKPGNQSDSKAGTYVVLFFVVIFAIRYWQVTAAVAATLVFLWFVKVILDEPRWRKNPPQFDAETPEPRAHPDASPALKALMSSAAVRDVVRDQMKNDAAEKLAKERVDRDQRLAGVVFMVFGGCSAVTLPVVAVLTATIGWAVLAALGVGMAIGGRSIWTRSKRDVELYQRDAELCEQEKKTTEAMSQAEPQSPTDTFGTCPNCGHIDCHHIVGTTAAGTTRNCAVCLKDWTVKHPTPA